MNVHRLVRDINVSKSSGLDNASSFIVKEAFFTILPEVTHMYNLSLDKSAFPDEWKTALVVPIPKAGDPTLVHNYRPISLLPLPGKILEKLVRSQLSDHPERNFLLTPTQHGFRRDHSTLHSVSQFTNYINAKMDSKVPTSSMFIDFRKAFDCVQHSILLNKLSKLQIEDGIVSWVKSYLSTRKQKVYANDTYSEYLSIQQGVPQGSVLGPLFYIIYANDLIKEIKHCKVALYADDAVQYLAKKNFDVSVDLMQQDIDSISRWCLSNGIMANTNKTKVMVFSSKHSLKLVPPFEIKFGNASLQTVSTYRYLGFTGQSTLLQPICKENYGLCIK